LVDLLQTVRWIRTTQRECRVDPTKRGGAAQVLVRDGGGVLRVHGVAARARLDVVP